MSGPTAPGDRPAPGWYPDPEAPGSGRQRWWDGQGWSNSLHPPLGPAGGTGDALEPSAASGWAAQGVGGSAQAVKVDPWLWQSIVATLLGFRPAGIVGLVFATRSQAAAAAGDLAGAQRYAHTARTWTLVAVGLTVFGLVGLLGLIAVMSVMVLWL
ncbi:MAG: CD225/dispanin family protein [Nitriliruptoraceae bacterium]